MNLYSWLLKIATAATGKSYCSLQKLCENKCTKSTCEVHRI